VGPALDALAELFENRERLSDMLTRVKKLREGMGFFRKEEKLAEIAALLGGPSIMVETKEKPVSQRNLLDAVSTEVAVLPDQLLAEMARVFQVARDVVSEVGDAWARLEPKLAELEHDVAAAQGHATDLGQTEAVRPELEGLAAELGRVRVLVSTDPLSVANSLDSDLGPRLRQVSARLTELAQHKASAQSRLGEVDSVLAQIAEATQHATSALARAGREIAGFDYQAQARSARREEARGLVPWRDKIATAASEGRWKAADVGLTRWFEVARGIIAAENGIVQRAAAAEDQRTELEGRLSARRAQASAVAARGRPGAAAGFEELAREAEACLRARPTDLARAAKAVEKYEAQVRALIAQGRT
jgi:hypothetical protein